MSRQPEPTLPSLPPPANDGGDELQARVRAHHQQFEDRQGLVQMGHLTQHASRRALNRSLSTFERAARCYERTVRLLGAEGWQDPDEVGGRRSLHRRDPEGSDWLVSFPLLRLTPLGPQGDGRHTMGVFVNKAAVIPSDAPPGWTHDDPPYWSSDPPPDILPEGPWARAGRIEFHEGERHLEISYDDRGARCESVASGGDSYWNSRHWNARPYAVDPLSRPPGDPPFSMLLRPDLRERGHAPGRIAAMAVELFDRELDPVRVRLPLPIPGGPVTVRAQGLGGVTKALFDGRIGDSGGIVIADGFRGEVVCCAPTFDEAWDAWTRLVQEVKPKPPGWGEAEAKGRPTAPPAVDGPARILGEDGSVKGFTTGTIHVTGGPGSETPWPIPVAAHVPALRVVVPAIPASIPSQLREAGFRRWVRFLAGRSGFGAAVVREDEDGFTFIGEGALDLVPDVAAMDAAIDVAERAEAEWMESLGPSGPARYFANPEFAARHHHWGFWDDPRREALTTPRHLGGGASPKGDLTRVGSVDLAWSVTRFRGAWHW